MSKIGRKPINISGVTVELDGLHELTYKGSKSSGSYIVPDSLSFEVKDKQLLVVVNPHKTVAKKDVRAINRVWGLHRVLLANKIAGSSNDFEVKVKIVGLGYKAAIANGKAVFSLGYSHKIDFMIPQGVSIDVDKTGQLLVIKSTDKSLAGQVASEIRSLRPPEPYKGFGVMLDTETIRRKAGKTKSS